jgi:hypothetical protein
MDDFRVKIKNFSIFVSIHQPLFLELGSSKRFNAPGMRAIDAPHKIILTWVIFRKKFPPQKFFSGTKNHKNCPFFWLALYYAFTFSYDHCLLAAEGVQEPIIFS